MLTRARSSLKRTLLLGMAASVAGFASTIAGAAEETLVEELIVHGACGTAAETENDRRQAERDAYLEALNEQLKRQLDEQLRNEPAARIKVALAQISNRG